MANFFFAHLSFIQIFVLFQIFGETPAWPRAGWHQVGGITPPQSPKPVPGGHVQIPPCEGKKDSQHRQEFKQLILYLKNNKQSGFLHTESGNKVKGVKN